MAIPLGPQARVMRIAHRGFSAIAPENTLSAVREAMAAGTDGVEFDVYLTKDAKLVLLHDSTVLRTTDFEELFGKDTSPKIKDLTLSDVRKLDAGSWKDPRFRGEPVPTIAEALEGHGWVQMRYVDARGQETDRAVRPLRVHERQADAQGPGQEGETKRQRPLRPRFDPGGQVTLRSCRHHDGPSPPGNPDPGPAPGP